MNSKEDLESTECVEVEALPNELLVRMLLFTELYEAYVVCRKWREIMTQETFPRQACLERWGNDVIINQYEKANEKERQLLLKEYFIPLTKDGQADWKRYHTMRSRFELALNFFTPLRRSELKKDRFRSSWALITASRDTALRTKHCLLILQLMCDIGRICLEQREYYQIYISIDKFSLFSDKHNHKNTGTLSTAYIASTDAKLIFKELLCYYHHSRKHERATAHTNNLFRLIMALFLEDMAFRGKKDKILEGIERAVLIHMKKPEQTYEFIDWFEHIYLPTCSAELAYEFLFKIFKSVFITNRQPGEPSEGLFELLDEERHILHSPSHLKGVMDLLLASETFVKIDTKFFTTLAELGAPFEAYMPRCEEKFYDVTNQSVWLSGYDSTLCANATNYLELVLLKHYPAEAQRVVIDMIEQCKPVLFWILGDAFNLVRQSLGDRWTEFRFRVVDMMLELYPLEVRTMTLKVDENSLLTGVTLDTVQLKCLNLLMTLPKLYPDETQRQILNVAMSQLYNSRNETNKTELQTKILKMPYMQQPINDNTLPYYLALQALSPNLPISDSLLNDITRKFVDKYFSA